VTPAGGILSYTSVIMPRPVEVTFTAALMALLTILGLVASFFVTLPVVPEGTPVSAGAVAAIAHGSMIFGTVISAIFIFLYWKGYSWVRWVVMIYSLFVIVSLVRIGKTFALSPISGVASIVSALLAVYLLYYLNTEPAKVWFNSPKS